MKLVLYAETEQGREVGVTYISNRNEMNRVTRVYTSYYIDDLFTMDSTAMTDFKLDEWYYTLTIL